MRTKILDCTIRDGGYLNNWQFSEQLVKDLYRAVSKSGVDYIEIGFRSSNKYFNPAEYGLWRFTSEGTVNEIVSGVSGAPVSLMVDYGKVELSDIPDAKESNVALYRVAVHKNRALDAIDLANQIAAKGYKVALQLMGIVGFKKEDFDKILKPIKQSKLSFIYFADSYGSLMPSDIKKYVEILRKTNKQIGFHPHNNLQLAFANVLEAIKLDVDVIDGTVFGMGRGAGNLPLETLITYFEKTVSGTKYNVLPVLEIIDKYFIELLKEFKWGYNLPYMISGVYEAHSNYAKYLFESGRYSISDVQAALQLINKLNPVGYDKNIIPQMEQAGFIGSSQTESGKVESQYPDKPVHYGKVRYKDRHKGKDFLVLANGSSLAMYQDSIKSFIKKYDPVIIGSNYLGGLFAPHYHSFNNLKRFTDNIKSVNPSSKLLISNSLPREIIKQYTDREYEIIEHSNDAEDFNIIDGVIMNNCKAVSVLSIAVAIVMGAQRIFIAGMDGYKDIESFIHKDDVTGAASKDAVNISSRSGEYREQMEWHNSIDKLLKQINDYLVSNKKNDLIIITPTTHRSFYKDIDSLLA